MLSGRMFKPLHFMAALLAATSLMACEAPLRPDVQTDDAPSAAPSNNAPTLAGRLNCLPKEGALVAAHRGTSRGKGLAENALESLEALYAGGVRVAEVDAARLKSGEHILFHDGVWDDKSTGQGAVASSRWRSVQDYLLRDTDGGMSTSRPALLKDVLTYAKGRLHLEIDFKSSADYRTVIDMIRAASMTDEVVLIAYNERQARAMAKLAPDMFISVSIESETDIAALERQGVKRSQMMAWVGKSDDRSLMRTLAREDITVLTYEAGNRRPFPEADVFVTDRALDKNIVEGAMGLSSSEKTDYLNCLANL